MIVNKKIEDVLKFVNSLNYTATLNFGETGLQIKGTDATMVCLFELDIKKDYFETYEPIGEVHLDIPLVLQAIKRFKKTIDIAVEENKLVLTESGRVFKLPINDDGSDMELPELNLTFDNKTVIPLKELASATDDIDIFSDTAIFLWKKGDLKLIGKNDTSKAEIDVYSENNSFAEDKETRVKVSMDYLKKIKTAKFADKITVSGSTDIPLEIGFKEEYLTGRLVIAPRVDD